MAKLPYGIDEYLVYTPEYNVLWFMTTELVSF